MLFGGRGTKICTSFIGAGEPIYKFSPNQSKKQHPEAQNKGKLARNPVDWVCKTQQLIAIRNLSPSYPWSTKLFRSHPSVQNCLSCEFPKGNPEIQIA